MENLQQLFIEAGTLMLAGMVFVFSFLGLLIVFINIVLVKLAKKYPDAIVESRASSKKNNKTQNGKGVSPAVVAAISSAVTQYRKQHSAQK
ncbi:MULTISPECIES: OadG family protein [Colwelliaceae]|uniref:Probable oxaloacetate decarboxylase gamma chain n=1 Tax=Cognaticolwellia beringensis TaxID=1967665 RepID=A0A222G4U4_9GAMM|nr:MULTISPECIES: OadG family transporter subunit [Colwelliaceae]ARD43392.1 oxaloacetate decarboxylase subunit gamma [Colwellia sp. PAMC 21821]ASP46821.1 oxaloacetate decarboxylase subunit gamma [Cognaticolwellia beringensis]|tara:strand:+ start:800 stop:1072 length:273 start_codon:yes stop_codon:yes gene_type:complete